MAIGFCNLLDLVIASGAQTWPKRSLDDDIGRTAANISTRVWRRCAAASTCRCQRMRRPIPPRSGASATYWRKRGDKAGARAAYEAALKIDPTFAEASDALKSLR